MVPAAGSGGDGRAVSRGRGPPPDLPTASAPAFVYGFASVILGASLPRSGLSAAQVGLVFASLLVGSAIASYQIRSRS